MSQPYDRNTPGLQVRSTECPMTILGHMTRLMSSDIRGQPNLKFLDADFNAITVPVITRHFRMSKFDTMNMDVMQILEKLAHHGVPAYATNMSVMSSDEIEYTWQTLSADIRLA